MGSKKLKNKKTQTTQIRRIPKISFFMFLKPFKKSTDQSQTPGPPAHGLQTTRPVPAPTPLPGRRIFRFVWGPKLGSHGIYPQTWKIFSAMKFIATRIRKTKTAGSSASLTGLIWLMFHVLVGNFQGIHILCAQSLKIKNIGLNECSK